MKTQKSPASLPSQTSAQTNAATGTKSETTANVNKRGPVEAYFPPSAWGISRREDGAVVATAHGFEEAHSITYAVDKTVTLVPPATQTTGVKTVTIQAPKAYGTPSFKITPFSFLTPNGQMMAAGLNDYLLGGQNIAGPGAIAAIRVQEAFLTGDSAEWRNGGEELMNYTMRVVDASIKLDGLPIEKNIASMEKVNSPFVVVESNEVLNAVASTSVQDSTLATQASTSPTSLPTQIVSLTRVGLSGSDKAGIGAGLGALALIGLAVGLVASYRRASKKKIAAKTKAFDQGIKMENMRNAIAAANGSIV